MAKASIWTSSVASVVPVTMAFLTMVSLTVSAMAQTRLDPSAASAAPVAVSGSSPPVAAPQQIAAPAPPSSSTPRAGSLQGFGQMQTNQLLGAQPLQDVGGK
jgi:hypothetical protein